jgi:predicted  nucleic acid-binding Zn-ribbon protein
MPKETITTGVDNLVSFIMEKKRVSVAEASKRLSVDRELIEEWADFLEERGVIKVEYKFTTPYLIYKEPDAKSASKSQKHFTTRKTAFTRQIDSTLQLIEGHAQGLTKVRDEFDKINAELEVKIKGIREELQELEKFETLKRDLGNELSAQYEEFKRRITSMESRLRKSEETYEQMIKTLEEETDELEERHKHLEGLKHAESAIISNLEKVKRQIADIESQRKSETLKIGTQQQKISILKLKSSRLAAELKKHKLEIKPVMAEFNKAHETSVKKKEALMRRFEDHLKTVEIKESRVEKIKGDFEQYLKRKIDIDIVMDNLTSEIEKLHAEFRFLKQESRILALTGKKQNTDKDMAKLEKRLKDALERKKSFEKHVEGLKKAMFGESKGNGKN